MNKQEEKKIFTVSVIITFYNQEKYVDATMQSVLDQKTDFDFEIIAGDDGSSDRTVELVQKWAERFPGRIRTFVRSREDGVTVAGFRASRNRLSLLEHVRGKYFIFLDGDDYFSDDRKLQKQVDILEAEENRGCVACSHYIEALYPDDRRVTLPVMQLSEGRYSLEDYWARLYFHTDTTLVRSSVIEKLPKEYVINNFNDNVITFLFLLQGSIYFLPEKMAVYLQTGDGIWTGQKAVVNQIRNMFMYDLCTALSPANKRLTDVRLAKTWKYLYKVRREIAEEELQPFVNEAQERELKYSLRFLKYRSLPFSQKAGLFFKTAAVWTRFCFYKALHR